MNQPKIPPRVLACAAGLALVTLVQAQIPPVTEPLDRVQSSEFYGVGGWMCATGQPYAAETDFTRNAGAGIRRDVTDQFLVKLLGGATWVEYSRSQNIATQLETMFSLGWRF